MILTSPSLLVEGVRSGSRRRNAASASALAGGGARPESRCAAPARGDEPLCGGYAYSIWPSVGFSAVRIDLAGLPRGRQSTRALFLVGLCTQRGLGTVQF